MKWSFQGKWLAGGFGLTLLFMGLVSFVSYKNATELDKSANRVQYTYEILNNLTDLYAAMSVAESGRRGYIYLGSERELKRYQIAVKDLQSEILEIQQQINSNPIELRRFANLKFLAARRLSLLRQSIELYQKDRSAVREQFLITEQSIQLRDKILLVLSQMQAQEKQELKILLQKSHANIQSRIFLEILGIFFSFVAIAGVYFMLYYQWKQHQKMESLKQTIAQEKEISELKNNIFSMISHEFRTPLSVILGSSQLLKESLPGLVDDSKLKNLYRIQSSVKLMNNLITDILMLTRAEAGKLECRPELLDVEAFCLNLVEDAQVLPQKYHFIKFISNNYSSRVYLDEKLLYSILNNLILNAIKYSPNGGNIYLILNQEKDAIIFQVKDEGIGVTLEDRQKIYEPFYRGQNVNSIVGSGLGLAVVKKCLELQRGEISLESEVGIGTTFTVRIPTLIKNLGIEEEKKRDRPLER
jgi:signal transduction histidine kinase